MNSTTPPNSRPDRDAAAPSALALRSVRFPVALLLCLLLALPSSAVPYLLNYQGRVAVGGQNHDGPGYFKFALVDGGSNQNRTATATASVSGSNRISGITITDGGSGYTSPPTVTISGTGSGAVPVATISGGAVTAITVEPAGGGYAAVPPPVVTIAPPPEDVQVSKLWTNDGTQLGLGEKVPVDWVELRVTRGLYSLQLGDTQIPGMSELSAKYFSQNDDLRLRVWFSPDGNVFTQLTPDQRIAAVGYAMMADDVKDGSITSAKLAPGAVTEASIAPGAITMNQLTPELQAAINSLIAAQQAQLPVVTSPNSAQVGDVGSLSYTITGSGSPTTFGATGLPAGLSLNGAVVSGIVTAGPGTYNFSVTATNIHGTSVPRVVTLNVLGPIHVHFSTGDDVNPGTATQPVKTLTHAVALSAGVSPKRNIRVSTAAHTISETLVIPEGVIMTGGFTTGTTWTASATRTPLHRAAGTPSAGYYEGITAVKLDPLSRLENFDITVANATNAQTAASWVQAGPSVGVDLTGGGQRVTNCRITPGNGGLGVAGDDGSIGNAGSNGADGGNPSAWTGGGPLGSGRRGGNGANLQTQNGDTAQHGGSNFGDQGASGGNGGANGATNGGNGGAGGDGTNGGLGAQGLAAASGGYGDDGQRGGGGGGGGGILFNGSLSGNASLWGGGGGQGADGGDGGNGGSRGIGGGHSIAIRIRHSSGASDPLAGYVSPILTGNILRPRDGGHGGTGGDGGLGGAGGDGGEGVVRPMVGSTNPGDGGDGGDGGNGGPGGGGGGGHGGNCYGIHATAKGFGSPSVPPVTQSGSTFELGNAGAGGLGGRLGGSTLRAATGNAGFVQNINTAP